MKWFKKISDLFSDLFKSTPLLSEQWVKLYNNLYTSKLNNNTYLALMYTNEIFHFYGKDWIIYNVSQEDKKIELHDCNLHFYITKLKLRSIEEDSRMSIEIDLSSIQLEKLIDIDKYITLNKYCTNFCNIYEEDLQKVKEILNK